MFGDNLKQLRKKKGLTQQQLADELGTTVRALSTYELNFREPNLEMIRKIAYFFQVSSDYLFDIDLQEVHEKEIARKKAEIINAVQAMPATMTNKLYEYIEFLKSKEC